MWRNDWQMGKRPFAALDLIIFWANQFEQMTDRRTDDRRLAFIIIIALSESTECSGDIAGNRRFLGNNQFFSHGVKLLRKKI